MKNFALLLFLIICTLGASASRGETLLYDHEFETGDTSEFNRTVTQGESTFIGNETRIVRKGRYSARMNVTLLSQRAYVEEILDPPLPEVFIKCAVRLGDDLEVFLMGELFSLVGLDPRKPVASLNLEKDLTLSLTYFDSTGHLFSVPASGMGEPLKPGTWYELELHFRSILHPKGSRFELFLDGAKILDLMSPQTQPLAKSVCYGQRMEWLDGTMAQGTIYFDICKGSQDSLIGQEPDKVAVVLVDRSQESHQAYEDYRSERVKGFLDHVGLPYLEIDVNQVQIDPSVLSPFDLIILGQEGLGHTLTQEEQTSIADVVNEGVGLFSFDPWIDKYSSAAFQQMMGNLVWSGSTTATWIEVPGTNRFITGEQPPDPGDRRYEWNGDVPQLGISSPGRLDVLAVSKNGPALVSGTHGQGRVCVWLLSSLLWDDLLQGSGFRYLGHLHGIDDLVWRGLVWTCRKPMVWYPLDQKYLALKIDDCRGRGFGGTPFQYLDIASTTLDIQVHAALFLNAIDESKAEILHSLQGQGKVDVSAHAFDGGDTNPNEPSEWHIYWDLPNDKPFTPSELAERWARVDGFFSNHDLPFSTVFAPSWGVAGIGNLSYLQNHDIVYANTINDFGTTQGTGNNLWKGSLPFHNGIHALDFMGAGEGPFNVSSWSDFSFWSYDFFIRYSVIPIAFVDSPEEAFGNARRQVQWAHGARFPMVLLTHEYVLEAAGFDLTDWSRFLSLLKNWADEKGIVFISLPEMIRITRNYTKGSILSYEKRQEGIFVLLEGSTDDQTHLEVWSEEDRSGHVSIPPFEPTYGILLPGNVPPINPGGGSGGCGCTHLPTQTEAPHYLLLLEFLLPILMVWGWIRITRLRTSCVSYFRRTGV